MNLNLMYARSTQSSLRACCTPTTAEANCANVSLFIKLRRLTSFLHSGQLLFVVRCFKMHSLFETKEKEEVVVEEEEEKKREGGQGGEE